MSYVDIISKLGEEVLTRKELEGIFNYSFDIVAYDGFELTGIPHISQVILKTHNVNQLIKCGCKFKFWIADVFTLLNNKFNGDKEKIKIMGEYMIEVWKAAGMDIKNVQFLLASEEIDDFYWDIILDISKKFTLERIKKCLPSVEEKKKKYEEHKKNSEKYKTEKKYEMAFIELEKANQILEKMDENISFSSLLYSIMQTTDVFFLGANICQLGLDQQELNTLSREYCEILNKEKNPIIPHRIKPIIISHHMLLGLQGEEKMSKSKPESCIFITDTEKDVEKKIQKAYCVPKDISKNPVLDYLKYLIFPVLDKSFLVNRKFEENLSFNSYEELEKYYIEGKIHPSELKPAVAREINILLEPIRKHFENNKRANLLLKKVKSFC
jgi:tyrosyl-tRNA synthetase